MKFVARISILLLSLAASSNAAVLPGAGELTGEADFSAEMVAGIDAFLLRETGATLEHRASEWHRDTSSPQAYHKSIESNRARFRKIIGAVDKTVPFQAVEFISDSQNSSRVAETSTYTIDAIRWPVFDGVHGEGLWIRQKSETKCTIIAIPDCDQTPEMLCSLELGINTEAQWARKLAEAGCEVFVMQLVNRSDTFSGNEALNKWTNQPHREWIYRQAYELGRHVIGYEVQKVLALVDWISRRGTTEIGLAGYGEGGLVAFYAAALDEQVKATLVSGYFGPRERLREEPIYRNIFGLLQDFGDAEIASMIAPRRLIVEFSPSPEINGPPAPRNNRNGAAPGKIWNFERYEVEDELNRARELFPASFATDFQFVNGQEGMMVNPGSPRALKLLGQTLGFDGLKTAGQPGELKDARVGFDKQARQARAVSELVDHTQNILRDSERFRDQTFWKQAGTPSAAKWAMENDRYKEIFWEEVIGKFDIPLEAPRPRARQIYDEPKWTGYEVKLDVWPDVFAWGILLVPKDLKEGERRPVVVCQHGLEGVPRDTIDPQGKTEGYAAYKSFAAKLAERGFITFAPHNPYRGHDRFRVLQRKLNPLGKSLFSVIVPQHEQILNWLQSLPFVDAGRIGFYGLSYGGKTAMRVPSLINRYALSICSADFNEWVKKNATVHSPYSYMFSGEYEIVEWDLGHTFNYAEMASLIAPRPFMVERGHDDGVAPDEWVAHEYARVRRFYDKLGIGDKTEIEFFNGPHTINGEGTFKFLHKHLNWPEPASN